MNQRNLKKLKRRFRKKLYHFLLAVNEFDFKKLRPLWMGIAFAALFITACLMPTTTKNNIGSPASVYGSAIADSIRIATTDISVLSHDTDVVAVFLPENYIELDTEEYVEQFSGKTLYSFYLTGKELFTLTEGMAALKSDTQTLYLDGLSFTYHENRLPFDRVTEVTLNNGVSVNADNTLYHVVSTEEIFALFHYIAYRSLGLSQVYPKSAEGTLLSDYREIIRQADAQPLTVASALSYTGFFPSATGLSADTSVVTALGGFNLIELWKSPNKITILMVTLFFTMVVLIWYAIQKLHRVKLWLRIYLIRSKKRGRNLYYSRRRSSSNSYRRAS